MRQLSILGLCLISAGASAADALPWAFVNGSADGYSVELVSASPKPGTPLCAASKLKFDITVKYVLQIKEAGKIILVIQDDNDSKIDGVGPLQASKGISKGRGTVVISDITQVPSSAKEVRLFIPVVPDGVEETDGELVLRYPISSCSKSE